MAKQWRGRGNGGAPQMGAATGQALELQFQTTANNLFEALMNWGEPQQLEQGWRQVMTLRNRCMQAYGGPVAPGYGGGGAAEGQNWKGEFYSAVGKKMKKSLTKDDVSWLTEETGPGQFQCTLHCECLKKEYKGKMAKSKKEAEHSVAQVALKAEFHQHFQEVLYSGGAAAAQPAQGGKGQKRKADEMQSSGEGPKQQLMKAAQLLKGTGETLTKGAVQYEVAEENSQYIATVTLQEYDPSVAYQGHPSSNKKDAETSAAEEALKALKSKIAPLAAEQEAKKKAKNQANLAKLKERQAAKKEAEGTAALEG